MNNKITNNETINIQAENNQTVNNVGRIDRVCNRCGKTFLKVNDIYREDFLEVNKDWGFFSSKDGKTYRFAICENCCESLVKSFVVPADISDTTELV